MRSFSSWKFPKGSGRSVKCGKGYVCCGWAFAAAAFLAAVVAAAACVDVMASLGGGY